MSLLWDKTRLVGTVGPSVQISAWLCRNIRPALSRPFKISVQSKQKLCCINASRPTTGLLLCFQSSLLNTKTVHVLLVDSYGWYSRSSSKCKLAQCRLSNTSSVCSAFYCSWRNMLSKKATNKQGENTSLSLWGLCPLYSVDNGEKSMRTNEWHCICRFLLCA